MTHYHRLKNTLLAVLGIPLIACSSTPPQELRVEKIERGERVQSHCFTAVATLAQPSHGVFTAAGRSGNGDTWYQLFLVYLNEMGTLGKPTIVTGLGDERSMQFDGRNTWVGLSPESDGCLICTGDEALMRRLEEQYQLALSDPAVLKRALAAVPAYSWDD